MIVIASYPDDRRQFRGLLYLIRMHEHGLAGHTALNLHFLNIFEKVLLSLQPWDVFRKTSLSQCLQASLVNGNMIDIVFRFPTGSRVYLLTCWGITKMWKGKRVLTYWLSHYSPLPHKNKVKVLLQFILCKNSETEAFGIRPRLREVLKEGHICISLKKSSFLSSGCILQVKAVWKWQYGDLDNPSRSCAHHGVAQGEL